MTSTAVTGVSHQHHSSDSGDISRSILSIRELSISFPKRYGPVQVLNHVELDIDAGECVAVVGESGCGKSLLGLAAASLLPDTATVTGEIRFRDRDTLRMSKRKLRALRGASIGVVYQDALTSLNPGMSVGAQLRQVCRLGSNSTPEQLLVDVGLTDTSRVMRAKPYQLSGGQRQRVLIAIALAREPDLIIADEPTTALDVTVQAQVVALLRELQQQRNFALLFISHDLALVSTLAHRTTVMYAGQVVESGLTRDVLTSPRHPYTAGLLAASVSLEEGHDTLHSIPGHVKPPTEFATGCRFRDRCDRAQQDCTQRPPLEVDATRRFACFHPIDQHPAGEVIA
ncbi:ABC transporter ATP-binding protein [Amycolatopsis thermoflava]|uniref:ABC transporter ATP-binding protein n=1 Tax=Amycolatopsis thermoflava TaxID=84480 RepID=UPI0036507F60